MAKDPIQELKPAAKEVVKSSEVASPPTAPAAPESVQPKMISVPAEEWEALKRQVAAVQVQQSKIVETMPAAVAAKLSVANTEHIEILNDAPPKEGTVRKKFLVDLFFCKPRILSIDVVPGAEFAVRDQAIALYNKHFGIIRTEHKHEVSEVVEKKAA